MKKIIYASLFFATLALNIAKADNTQTSQSSSAGEFKKVGGAGSQFLKIGVGARANAMAGAYTAFGGDLTCLYWNPAGLSTVNGMAVDVDYTDWIASFKHAYAAASMPLGENFKVAVSLTSLSTDKIMVTTLDNPDGDGTKYSISDMALGASLAGHLTNEFSFGFTVKYINNSFANSSANGAAIDIGTLYETGIHGINLGFSIMNLGTNMQYEGTDMQLQKKYIDATYSSPLQVNMETSDYTLPLTFRAAVSGEAYKEGDNKVIVAGQFENLSDTQPQYALGAEYTWKDFVAVRAGYRFGQDEFGFGVGVGLKYNLGGYNGEINYSANPTKDFGTVSRFSISFGM